ncbi:MAG: Uma2 family endonuclease [Geitlerinemataceae cyanobacterium]
MLATKPISVTWDKLPDDFPLPGDPVDNINQPAIAAALTDSLQTARRLPETALTATNYGICATTDGRFVVKAPDWVYIDAISVPRSEIARSYTPNLQGNVPTIVLEFLSDTEGSKYSSKATYPPGKFFFYERIVRVPNYGIFEPNSGSLELYRLDENGRYQLVEPNSAGRYWLPELGLFLGGWFGRRENREGHWLRWWEEGDRLLLWGNERAELERERAERFLAQLRAAGIEPEDG